jgi:hypothetical protein
VSSVLVSSTAEFFGFRQESWPYSVLRCKAGHSCPVCVARRATSSSVRWVGEAAYPWPAGWLVYAFESAKVARGSLECSCPLPHPIPASPCHRAQVRQVGMADARQVVGSRQVMRTRMEEDRRQLRSILWELLVKNAPGARR